MMGDLKQIRRFAGIIQRLEIDFDLLSAVDELADQVRLEFDFDREAAVMDAIADDLQVLPLDHLRALVETLLSLSACREQS